MYLRSLRLQNLKLLRDVELDFVRNGKPRMWTAIVAPNGYCKTSILHAIALCASGFDRGNQLADVASLPDRRQDKPRVSIDAEYEFPSLHHEARAYPQLAARPAQPPRLRSALQIDPGWAVFKGTARYADASGTPIGPDTDPLQEARATNERSWFVAGYGTDRTLPEPGNSERMRDPSLARLLSLFNKGRLRGTGFADILDNPREYAKELKRVLVDDEVLPRVADLELRGKGGVSDASKLVESHRFAFTYAGADLKVPAIWLSHGYQSTIAWVADLVGHLFLDGATPNALAVPAGLVLIDEIDLHLHPQWQVALVPALKRAFPSLQFVVTTHSPMVLPGLDRDEIVLLQQAPDGDVTACSPDESAKLMSGSELYESFFGIEGLHPTSLSRDLDRYLMIASNPVRSDQEDAAMLQIAQRLTRAGVPPQMPPVSRTR